MAFVSLMTLLGYEGKVAAHGGHSWTELVMTMNLEKGRKAYFKVSIDNTFDKINWSLFSENDIKKWETELGDSKTKRWYNDKALSAKEQNRIANFQISPSVMHKLEQEFVSFLNRKI